MQKQIGQPRPGVAGQQPPFKAPLRAGGRAARDFKRRGRDPEVVRPAARGEHGRGQQHEVAARAVPREEHAGAVKALGIGVGVHPAKHVHQLVEDGGQAPLGAEGVVHVHHAKAPRGQVLPVLGVDILVAGKISPAMHFHDHRQRRAARRGRVDIHQVAGVAVVSLGNVPLDDDAVGVRVGRDARGVCLELRAADQMDDGIHVGLRGAGAFWRGVSESGGWRVESGVD